MIYRVTSLDTGQLSMRHMHPRKSPLHRERWLLSSLKAMGLPLRSYLSLYGIIVLATMGAYFVVWFFYIIGSMHASRVLHSRLVSSILGTTLR